MRVGIMQPYIFPYLGYFHLINASDSFIFLDNVNFIKKGWINRNKILVNGSAYQFTIPIVKPSQNKLITESIVLDESGWRNKLVKTVEMAYKNAPEFSSFMPVFESVIELKGAISQMAIESVIRTMDYLGITKSTCTSSEIIPAIKGKGQERIINLCRYSGADSYVNASGGRLLYDPLAFSQQNIELSFVMSQLDNYPQSSHDFVPALSIIDVAMNNSRENCVKLMHRYTLDKVG